MFKVRIIVLNYNGMEIIPRCLPSLFEAAQRSPYPTRLTLLDNGSRDGSVEWAQKNFPRVEVFRAPQNRLLFSFNDYVKQVVDDIVILMNNDIRVDPDFVAPLVRVFENYPDAFLAAPQTMDFEGRRYEGGRTRAQIRWGLFWSSALFPQYEALRGQAGYTFASGFGAFHRKRFIEMGGYDDLYLPGIMEDADLGFRSWRQGYRSYYVPQSRVYHLGQASFKKAFGERGILILAHRNSFLFLWKNFSDPSFLAEHFLLLIPRLFHALLTGKRELVIGFYKALGKAGEAFKKRRFPIKRARTDRELLALVNERPAHRLYRYKKKWKRMLAGLLDAAGSLFSLFGVFPLFSRPPESVPRRILVIRLDSMGDGVLALPAVRALSAYFTNAKIDFLVSSAIRDLYVHLFPSSQIHTLKKNWLTEKLSLFDFFQSFYSTARRLHSYHYDLGVDFRGDLRNILLMACSGIGERWGRMGTGGGFLLHRKVLTGPEKHEVLSNLELIRRNSDLPSPDFSASLRLKIEKKTEKKTIVMHMGAGYPSKRWPANRFVEVAGDLSRKNLGVPVFIGTSEDRQLLEPLRNHLSFEHQDLIGRTSFEELMSVIAQADLFIGNDSGPAHLAALLGKKMVVVFSGTNNWRQWSPWSSQIRLIQKPVPCSPCEKKTCPLERQICLEEISAEEVIHAVEEMLHG